ncbi:hypothetical protein CGCSCA4_v005945 [Colletotrichum siamense]|uniref:Uncharacterized protein n=1 Tax=Colletotrichum siamense TaxID=690259 RepID=A0A9P5BQW7_COLSI|nr:hypothetical protein CGCSCA4_v005945 [Colletotrichum siamense]KAF4849296.1 hypothetical protein CGCSCA2_v011934 [Colletotrichum siamense]
MASHIYTIQVKNKWQRCRFSLSARPLTEPPKEGATQVYQLSPPIEAQADGSSTANFKIKGTFFAVQGSRASGNTSSISTQESRKIHLGPGGSVFGIKMEDGAVVWDDTSTKGQTTEVKDGFEFWTDSSIRNDAKGEERPLCVDHVGSLCLTNVTLNTDDIFIGVGLVDPRDSEQVAPFDVFHPKASSKYIILPRMKIVLTASHHEHGEHVDTTTSTYAGVDFSDCQVPKAYLTFDAGGHLVDDHDRSKQNGVGILPYGSEIDAIHVEKIGG